MMKKTALLLTLFVVLCSGIAAAASWPQPWEHGPLAVSADGRFLQHRDGTPFFWLADTGWLLPERLNRDEAAYYLQRCAEAGYNVVQVQVLNDLPAWNVYGQSSDTEAYWQHMDYIVGTARRHGIYIGMVAVWGSQVKNGRMTEALARDYGTFLARRYRECPNIVWMMGGDIQGDIHPEVWTAMATAIKAEDKDHLMTYHPRGRYTSARWWAGAAWIDFHTFQSGHRRYGQRTAKDTTYPIPDCTEEDNWQYVDSTWARQPLKPVLDAEPIYEDIPQGLHDGSEPRWQAADVRRYAYWSVFAGSCGHTYGHNSIMQFYRPGLAPAYFARIPWYDALDAPGFQQMHHLKDLLLRLPYFDRRPAQHLVLDNGTRYERLAATCGTDYLLVYNCTGREMHLDLNGISGERKRLWWMDAATGRLTYIGEQASRTVTLRPYVGGDGVLIAIDAEKDYL